MIGSFFCLSLHRLFSPECVVIVVCSNELYYCDMLGLELGLPHICVEIAEGNPTHFGFVCTHRTAMHMISCRHKCPNPGEILLLQSQLLEDRHAWFLEHESNVEWFRNQAGGRKVMKSDLVREIKNNSGNYYAKNISVE